MYIATVPYQAVKFIRSSCTGSGALEVCSSYSGLVQSIPANLNPFFWGGEGFFSWLGCCQGILEVLVFFLVWVWLFFQRGLFCFINHLWLWPFPLPFGWKGECVSNVPDNKTGMFLSLILSMKRRKKHKTGFLFATRIFV